MSPKYTAEVKWEVIPEGGGGTEGPLRLCVSLYRFPKLLSHGRVTGLVGRSNQTSTEVQGKKEWVEKNPKLKLQKGKRPEWHMTHSGLACGNSLSSPSLFHQPHEGYHLLITDQSGSRQDAKNTTHDIYCPWQPYQQVIIHTERQWNKPTSD